MDDLISRQTAMNAFAEYVRRSNNSDFAPTPTWNDAVEIVENLPSADVQPVRHGRWSVFATSLIGNALMQCSECGKVAYDPYRYCPNCGARMDFEKGDKEK